MQSHNGYNLEVSKTWLSILFSVAPYAVCKRAPVDVLLLFLLTKWQYKSRHTHNQQVQKYKRNTKNKVLCIPCIQ